MQWLQKNVYEQAGKWCWEGGKNKSTYKQVLKNNVSFYLNKPYIGIHSQLVSLRSKALEKEAAVDKESLAHNQTDKTFWWPYIIYLINTMEDLDFIIFSRNYFLTFCEVELKYSSACPLLQFLSCITACIIAYGKERYMSVSLREGDRWDYVKLMLCTSGRITLVMYVGFQSLPNWYKVSSKGVVWNKIGTWMNGLSYKSCKL